MTFHIITIFPESFDSYFASSVIGRAIRNKLIEVKLYNLRDFTTDKHYKVDDAPYGGGAGMILKAEPIFRAVKHVEKIIKAASGKYAKTAGKKISKEKSRIILFSAKGKRYHEEDAERLKNFEHIILICGRYEGVDERVAEHLADCEISIGDYILTGGEIPAMALVDSVSRLVPGVLGNIESIEDESFSVAGKKEGKEKHSQNLTEYPQYTRPEDFKGWKVPEVLLGGHHDKIKKWRESKRKKS